MTKTYQVQGPDGQIHEFSGPDGATPAQVMSAAQAQFGGPSAQNTAQAQFGGPSAQNTAQAQPQPQHNMVPPDVAAATQNQPDTGIVGKAGAAMHSFENMVTFGQGDKVSAALATWLQPAAHAIGLRSEAPKGYSENLQDIKGQYGALEGANSVSSLAGSGLGLVGGGEVLGLVGKGGKAALEAAGLGKVAAVTERLLTPVAGKPMANLARNAGLSAGISGGMSAAEGDDASTVAFNSGVGAVLGPAAGAVAGKVARMFQGSGQKAMMALSKALKMTPDDLQGLYTKFMTETNGKVPSMTELVNFKSEGELARMAAQNADVGVAANQAAGARTPSLAAQKADAAQWSFPQTEQGLVQARNAAMDRDMGRHLGVSQNPTYAKPVPVTAEDMELLSDSRLRPLLREDPLLRKRINAAMEDLTDPANANGVSNRLTVDDFDNIRQMLRGKVSNLANPNVQGHNPHLAKRLGELSDAITGIAKGEVPEYGAALDNFKKVSDYISGFRTGQGGKDIGSLRAGLESSSVLSPEGQAGYGHGQQLYSSQKKLSAISPASIRPEDNDAAQMGSQALQAAGSAASGWWTATINHAVKSLPGAHFSEATQAVISKMLFSNDPAVVKQGIANLRRARVKDADILTMGQRLGGAVGANITHVMQGN